jgi:hypothetical protein
MIDPNTCGFPRRPAPDRVIFEARSFDPYKVVKVYARRYSDGNVKIFDVDERGKTVREYWVHAAELRTDLIEKLRASDPSQAFNQVRLTP